MTLTLVRPNPDDAMALSNGKHQTTIVDDIMDALEAVDAILRAGAKVTATLAAGATTMVLTAAFTQPNAQYQAILECSWQTTWIASTKTTTGMTIAFGVAVPTTGGTVTWRIER